MGHKEIKEAIATVVGGAATATPNWFSGAGGVSGVVGCWSVSQGAVSDWPIGIVLPQNFDAPIGVQGEEDNTDDIELLLLVARNDNEAAWAALDPFRDSIPAAFRPKLQLNATTNVGITHMRGETGLVTWGGIEYVAWKFTLTVNQVIIAAYAQ